MAGVRSDSYYFWAGVALLSAAAGIILPRLLLSKLDYFGTGSRRSKQQLPLPPPPRSWWATVPLMGESIHFLRMHYKHKLCDFLRIREATEGTVFRTSLIGSSTLVDTSGSSFNRFIFTNDGKLFANKWPLPVPKLIGEQSLLSQSGERHRRLRAAFYSFLKPEALQKFLIPMHQTIRVFLSTHFESRSNGRDVLLVLPTMKIFAFTLVCKLLLSITDPAHMQKLFTLFSTVIRGMACAPINVPGTRYRRALVARKTLDIELDRIISKRRLDLLHGIAPLDQDALSYLILEKDANDHPLLSDRDIKDNLVLILTASHDTTAGAATFLIKFLAEQPAYIDEIVQEQEAIARSSEERGKDIDWHDLHKMKRSWRFMQEVLRVVPPVEFTFRQTTKDFEYKRYFIPRGWMASGSCKDPEDRPIHRDDDESDQPPSGEQSAPLPSTTTIPSTSPSTYRQASPPPPSHPPPTTYSFHTSAPYTLQSHLSTQDRQSIARLRRILKQPLLPPSMPTRLTLTHYSHPHIHTLIHSLNPSPTFDLLLPLLITDIISPTNVQSITSSLLTLTTPFLNSFPSPQDYASLNWPAKDKEAPATALHPQSAWRIPILRSATSWWLFCTSPPYLQANLLFCPIPRRYSPITFHDLNPRPAYNFPRILTAGGTNSFPDTASLLTAFQSFIHDYLQIPDPSIIVTIMYLKVLLLFMAPDARYYDTSPSIPDIYFNPSTGPYTISMIRLMSRATLLPSSIMQTLEHMLETGFSPTQSLLRGTASATERLRHRQHLLRRDFLARNAMKPPNWNPPSADP